MNIFPAELHSSPILLFSSSQSLSISRREGIPVERLVVPPVHRRPGRRVRLVDGVVLHHVAAPARAAVAPPARRGARAAVRGGAALHGVAVRGRRGAPRGHHRSPLAHDVHLVLECLALLEEGLGQVLPVHVLVLADLGGLVDAALEEGVELFGQVEELVDGAQPVVVRAVQGPADLRRDVVVAPARLGIRVVEPHRARRLPPPR
mmetsp:Transcript_14754/g.34207  ORF Transcript_14754/g.34207 Transcript_14754/m.34207 type:complete len:205 (+) Transcript_14754:137-751(+)